MNVKMQYVNALEVLNCYLVVVVYVEVLQEVLYVQFIYLVWHVKVPENHAYHLTDFLTCQVPVFATIEHVE